MLRVYFHQKKSRREDLRKNKKLEIFGAEIEFRSLWSQLQDDLLRDIMSRLNYADQVRSRAVCKSWLAVDQHKKGPSYSLPWVVSIEELWNNKLEWRFYEPSNPIPVTVYKIKLHELGTIEYTLWSSDTICKYGWLFSSIERQSENRTRFLLFSPLTKEVFTLPCVLHKKKTRKNSSFLKAFSAEPNSPHCVFLVLDNHASSSRINIRTCCPGDKKWACRKYDLDTRENFSSAPVYFQGIFYFLSTVGDMASYNVSTEEFKVERYVIDGISYWNCLLTDRSHEVFELNGELVLVYFYDHYYKSGRIKRFDWCDKVWSPVKSLGDEALFVSRNSFLVGNEARSNGVLPNKIYRLDDFGCTVYNLVNGDLIYSGSVNWDKAKRKFAFWVEPPSTWSSCESETAKEAMTMINQQASSA